MKNLGITVAFGIVSYFASYFVVSPDLRIFNLCGAIGVMGGYQVGRLTSGKARVWRTKIVLLIAAELVCFASAMTYAVMVQMVSANTSDVVIMGLFFTVFFFALGFLFPIAGVAVDLHLPRRSGKGGTASQSQSSQPTEAGD